YATRLSSARDTPCLNFNLSTMRTLRFGFKITPQRNRHTRRLQPPVSQGCCQHTRHRPQAADKVFMTAVAHSRLSPPESRTPPLARTTSAYRTPPFPPAWSGGEEDDAETLRRFSVRTVRISDTH